MDNAQLINQDSGNTEWYTPVEIVDKEVFSRIGTVK